MFTLIPTEISFSVVCTHYIGQISMNFVMVYSYVIAKCYT